MAAACAHDAPFAPTGGAEIAPFVAALEIEICPGRLRGVGAKGLCRANGRTVGGTSVSVHPTWRSSDVAVVEVDAQGVVTATGYGTARVVASVDMVTASWDVRVVSSTTEREAQSVAVYLSGELWPPAPLTERAYEGLEAIRQQFGDEHEIVDDNRFLPPWGVPLMTIWFTDEGAAQVQSGTYHAWDSLNAELGVTLTAPSEYFDWNPRITLHFGSVLHLDRAIALYAALPGVKSAGRNVEVRTPPVYPRATDTSMTFLFNERSGRYCHLGSCDVNWYSYFVVLAGRAIHRGSWIPDENPEVPAWWAEATEGLAAWQ